MQRVRTCTASGPALGRASERARARYSARTDAEGDVLSTTTDLGGEAVRALRTASRHAWRVLSVSWFCARRGCVSEGRREADEEEKGREEGGRTTWT